MQHTNNTDHQSSVRGANDEEGRQRKHKARGSNKTNILQRPEFVDVNEHGQPITDSGRQLSTLIGCFARDPRRLPLDCWDIRLLEQAKLDSIWEEVKV